jgi:hypothetical protein
MPAPVITTSGATAARVARLACMPEDADAAIAHFKQQVQSAWVVLDRRARLRLLLQALRAAAPLLPVLSHPGAAELAALLTRLDDALAHHHPEELRVASFAWLSALVEVLEQGDGAASAAEILDSLECSRA